MMRIFFGTFTILILLNHVLALECFFCIGSTTSDCADGITASMVIQDCDYTTNFADIKPFNQTNELFENRAENGIVTTCVSFISNESPPATYFQRGCGYIFEGVDICWYMGMVMDLDACFSCDTDLCNNNPL